MAVQKNKVSKSKKRMRRSHNALSKPAMIVCPNCGELTLQHRACSSCGFYKGQEVIKMAKNAE